jgi:SAM-dependent methyltransferase
VDLYPAEVVEGYRFVEMDIVDYATERFDNVCCVSSWEHCGIETWNCRPGRKPDLGYHLVVAEKLKVLVGPRGRLILTCPLGPDETWWTYGGGVDVLHGEEGPEGKAPEWGYRTLTLETLERIFAPLRLVACEAREHRTGDYFQIENWKMIDARTYRDYCAPRVGRAVVGVVFERTP